MNAVNNWTGIDKAKIYAGLVFILKNTLYIFTMHKYIALIKTKYKIAKSINENLLKKNIIKKRTK